MDYAEASYFDGFHFQHIAAFKEMQRLEGIQRRHRVHVERTMRERRSGSRILKAA